MIAWGRRRVRVGSRVRMRRRKSRKRRRLVRGCDHLRQGTETLYASNAGLVQKDARWLRGG